MTTREVPVQRTSEKGYVLISVIVAVSLVLLTLLVASTYTQFTSKLLVTQLTYQGQALNTAQAGLVEGADYFRRQATQPVTAYNPTRNLSASPPVDDTDLPNNCTSPQCLPVGCSAATCRQNNPLSIQRDFLISQPGRVFGHYELVTGSSTAGTGVADLTQNRRGSLAGSGAIWQLESTGTIYVQNDASVAYNVPPNLILATKTVRGEIQKIALNIQPAAIAIQNANSCTVGQPGGPKARVVGTTSGTGVVSVSGAPVVDPAATLSGSPNSSVGMTAPQFSYANVFGISTVSDIAAVADISVTSEANLPSTLPPMQLILINKGVGTTVTFDSTRPLVGSGILVVVGNLVINGGPSSFSGVIYVDGNFTETGAATVSGSVIVARAGATALVNGTADFGEVYYDRFIISQIQQQLSQYRFSRPGYVPCPSWDTKCNSKFAGS